ncbi:MAG TPA: MarR family winged helix-turn-helix transcriptional regulator [Candidatus Cryptobacteroides sp.]|nr:MarR family winged helix-turn-helix transcriptional regulator [Candidatus Cryptobacteroides sp.]
MPEEEIHPLIDNMRGLALFYQAMGAELCGRWGISQTELDIVGFLGSHPQWDRARDIVELRLIPKANVSEALSSLLDKGIVAKKENGSDRRSIHLKLTPKGKKMLPYIAAMRAKAEELLFGGFSAGERDTYNSMNSRIIGNVNKFLEMHNE